MPKQERADRFVMVKFACGIGLFFVVLIGGMLFFSMNGFLNLAIFWGVLGVGAVLITGAFFDKHPGVMPRQ